VVILTVAISFYCITSAQSDAALAETLYKRIFGEPVPWPSQADIERRKMVLAGLPPLLALGDAPVPSDDEGIEDVHAWAEWFLDGKSKTALLAISDGDAAVATGVDECAGDALPVVPDRLPEVPPRPSALKTTKRSSTQASLPMAASSSSSSAAAAPAAAAEPKKRKKHYTYMDVDVKQQVLRSAWEYVKGTDPEQDDSYPPTAPPPMAFFNTLFKELQNASLIPPGASTTAETLQRFVRKSWGGRG